MNYFSSFLRLILIITATTTQAEDVFELIDDKEQSHQTVIENVFDSIDAANIDYFKSAKIIVMNKITANSKEFQLNIGNKISYGKAEVELHKCAKINNSPDDNLLLVTLKEKSFNEDMRIVFKGWLFSKTPSLSAVEHPVYQLIAVSCS